MSQQQPAQKQDRQPGREAEMTPRPDYAPLFPGVGRLEGRVALISGGDSGIGRAVAVAMANEGADVAIAYLDEHEDAAETARAVEAEGRRCLTIAGDIGDPGFCRHAVEKTVQELGRLDILVNNAAEQHEIEDFAAIDPVQIERTFRTNIFGMFFLTKEALKHLGEGAAIVNTTSVTAYKGHKTLIDYAATKGAIVSFTRSMAQALAEKQIRVNAVAPGPIWTPLIPASFEPEKVAKHGGSVPLGRVGQPNEVASCYVFLASRDAGYITGQVIHPNGGTPVES
ncbi:SDR family oxidoreductase [Rhodoplanes sp. TEM]|uniref:SDR family oxidoreductase n=1 Tax=Rhodoplanes tepidamans TaxID=200616 RepID=A0ABT5JDP8_RHOTP|nr:MULTISPECIES: SDR family oxidoreductase [Rhodoplanes]MDC7787815.1 SDR family oxidoreductase [Rhodoplanes tepidamans]MDC7987421.1 SDR family oxidoreductase [Rhodoplanes sp. TEM]MDQ0357731.1 NAD(P)-dependent dehydrogenase (short-subunit alcohol dehydrogenase family) [Rhodoplanes tepidamans]